MSTKPIRMAPVGRKTTPNFILRKSRLVGPQARQADSDVVVSHGVKLVKLTTLDGRQLGIISLRGDKATLVGTFSKPRSKSSGATPFIVSKLSRDFTRQAYQQALAAMPPIAKAPVVDDKEPLNSAATAMTDLRERLSRQGFLAEAKSPDTDPWYLGQKQMAAWVDEGVLIPSSELAEKWGRTRQALEHRLNTNKLFAVKYANRRLYYARLAELDPDVVAKVCENLVGLDNTSQLAFWMELHGALDGRSPVDVLREGRREGLEKVCSLARATVEEEA